VESRDGVVRPARAWVPANGQPRQLKDARVTTDRYPVDSVVCVKARGIKDAWCLAVGGGTLTRSKRNSAPHHLHCHGAGSGDRARRELAAEWLNVPADSLTSDVSWDLPEWGVAQAPGGYRNLHQFAVAERDLFRVMQPMPGASLEPASAFGHRHEALP
jgi:hypothetical protein